MAVRAFHSLNMAIIDRLGFYILDFIKMWNKYVQIILFFKWNKMKFAIIV